MAFSHAQLVALEAAIAEGVTKVRYGDKEVQYRSLDEMLRIRDKMRAELGLGSGIVIKQGIYSKGC